MDVQVLVQVKRDTHTHTHISSPVVSLLHMPKHRLADEQQQKLQTHMQGSAESERESSPAVCGPLLLPAAFSHPHHPRKTPQRSARTLRGQTTGRNKHKRSIFNYSADTHVYLYVLAASCLSFLFFFLAFKAIIPCFVRCPLDRMPADKLFVCMRKSPSL